MKDKEHYIKEFHSLHAFIKRQYTMIKERHAVSTNNIEEQCLAFTANVLVDIMDEIAEILEPKTKRLFIESDVLDEDELETSECTVSHLLLEQGIEFDENKVFDEVRDFAWQKGDEAWESVKKADEIYAHSSLIPLGGYSSYNGAPAIMDIMMKKAIEEKIVGKSLIFLREKKDINWELIEYKLLSKVFGKGKNHLFTLEEDENFNRKLVEVDVKTLVKELNGK